MVCVSPEILYTFKKDELKCGKVQRIASKMNEGMEILHPKILNNRAKLFCLAIKELSKDITAA